MAAAVVKEEEESLSEESDEEEWRWHGSGGDEEEDKLEEMEEDDDDDKEEATKLRQLKRDRENRWRAQRAEIRRRLLAGEDPPEVGAELKEKILKQWERRMEYDRRRRAKAKEARKGRGKVKREVKVTNQKERRPRRRKYPDLTPEEQRKMRREKDRFKLLEKRLNMTEEEREEMRRKKYFQMEAWRAKLTKEEREEMRRRQCARERRRYEGKSEEEKRRMVERHKEWRRGLGEEKRRQYFGRIYESIKKMNERKKREDPEGWRRRNAEKGKRQWQRMGEEEKERRRKMMRLYQWRRKFRGELEGTMGEEDIERRVREEEERRRVEWGIGPPRRKGNFTKKLGVNKVEGMEEETRKISQVEGTRRSGRMVNKVEFNYGGGNSEEDDGGGGGDDFFDDYEPPPPLLEVEVPQQQEEMEVPFMVSFVSVSAALPLPPAPPLPFLVPVENVTVNKCAVNVTPVLPPMSVSPVGRVETAVVNDVKLRPFVCEFCPRPTSMAGPSSSSSSIKYFSEEELKCHLKTKHLANCWKCPICREVVLDPKQLSEHFAAVHRNPVKKIQNSVHPVSLSTSTLVAKSSKICNEKIKVDRQQRLLNKMTNDSARTFLCMKCPWKVNKSRSRENNKVFETSRELHKHVKKMHKKHYWPCKHCNLLKYSKDKLRLHQKHCGK